MKSIGVVVLGPKQPVLSPDVEHLLIQHIAHMERYLYGLSTVNVRRLAFVLAERFGIKQFRSKDSWSRLVARLLQSSSGYSYPQSTGYKYYLQLASTKQRLKSWKVTSGERGTTATVICANYALRTDTPPQSVGCCSNNGWTECNLFVRWLENFVDVTNESVNVPQLITLDGHLSHKNM